MLLKLLFAAWLSVVADCQHLPKIGRLPSISSSLVNLGKMDISIHFNSHTPENSAQKAPEIISAYPAPSTYLGPNIMSEPSGVCPCMRNTIKHNTRGPADMLSRILMGNDLFTNNKEPISSSLCCGNSMEHVEETVIIDLTKPQGQSFGNILPLSLPFAMDTLYKPPSLPKMPGIEVFLYPMKKNMTKMYPKKTKKTKEWERVHPVGDKDVLNDFFNIRAFPPIKTSVKKDLNLQKKVPIAKIDEEPAREVKLVEIEKSSDMKVAKNIAKDLNDIANNVNNIAANANELGAVEKKKD